MNETRSGRTNEQEKGKEKTKTTNANPKRYHYAPKYKERFYGTSSIEMDPIFRDIVEFKTENENGRYDQKIRQKNAS